MIVGNFKGTDSVLNNDHVLLFFPPAVGYPFVTWLNHIDDLKRGSSKCNIRFVPGRYAF